MIEQVEDALVALCNECLGAAVGVASGPGQFDGAYLKTLIPDLPAVRVAWHGGEAADSTELSIFGSWSIYVFTGWAGKDDVARRRGTNSSTVLAENLPTTAHRRRPPADM